MLLCHSCLIVSIGKASAAVHHKTGSSSLFDCQSSPPPFLYDLTKVLGKRPKGCRWSFRSISVADLLWRFPFLSCYACRATQISKTFRRRARRHSRASSISFVSEWLQTSTMSQTSRGATESVCPGMPTGSDVSSESITVGGQLQV